MGTSVADAFATADENADGNLSPTELFGIWTDYSDDGRTTRQIKKVACKFNEDGVKGLNIDEFTNLVNNTPPEQAEGEEGEVVEGRRGRGGRGRQELAEENEDAENEDAENEGEINIDLDQGNGNEEEVEINT